MMYFKFQNSYIMNTIHEKKSRYPELMIQMPLSFEKTPLLSHCLIYQEEGQQA